MSQPISALSGGSSAAMSAAQPSSESQSVMTFDGSLPSSPVGNLRRKLLIRCAKHSGGVSLGSLPLAIDASAAAATLWSPASRKRPSTSIAPCLATMPFHSTTSTAGTRSP